MLQESDWNVAERSGDANGLRLFFEAGQQAFQRFKEPWQPFLKSMAKTPASMSAVAETIKIWRTANEDAADERTNDGGSAGTSDAITRNGLPAVGKSADADRNDRLRRQGSADGSTDSRNLSNGRL